MSKEFYTTEVDSYGLYDSYEKAEAAARRRAWNNGEDQLIMETIAVVEKPELVNTVKVTKV